MENIKSILKNKTVQLCFASIIVVLLIYIRSIFFDIKAYDELAIFAEEYLPIPGSFFELKEYILNLGLNQHFVAANSVYTNISSFRSNPLGNLLQLTVQFLFKNNPINYHIASLFLHLLNTAIVYIVLNKFKALFTNQGKSINIFIVPLLTLTWSLHPTSIEAILLATNFLIVFSCTAILTCIYLFITSFNDNFSEFKIGFIKSAVIFTTYLVGLFIVEYMFYLPLIIFSISFIVNTYISPKKSIQSSFISSFKSSFIFFLASSIYILSTLLSKVGSAILSQKDSLGQVAERVLWLSPQIFVHFIKLVVFPSTLSIDQSLLVKTGNALFDPYSIFCILTTFVLFFLAIVSLRNKTFPFFFFILMPFLISLIPFLHIIAPVYNLASERYLYLPIFFLVMGFSIYCFHLVNNNKKRTSLLLIILSVYVLFMGTRTFIRISDWENSETLYASAIKSSKTPLQKALRYKNLIPQEHLKDIFPHKKVKKDNLLLAKKNFEESIKYYKKRLGNKSPSVLKVYGIDPETLLVKSAYNLAQMEFTLTNDIKKPLEIIKLYEDKISLLDRSGVSFYSSLLYFNGEEKKAEDTLIRAAKKYPYSTQIVYQLCDLLFVKYNDVTQIETHTKRLFKYFPYDRVTLNSLAKLYAIRNDKENIARHLYLLGLRTHSINYLKAAKKLYSSMDDNYSIKKVQTAISKIESRRSKLEINR